MLIQQSIEKKLTETFAPTFLQIENESHMHSSGRGSESHFKVTLVTEAFNGKRSVARHQSIYQHRVRRWRSRISITYLHTKGMASHRRTKTRFPTLCRRRALIITSGQFATLFYKLNKYLDNKT